MAPLHQREALTAAMQTYHISEQIVISVCPRHCYESADKQAKATLQAVHHTVHFKSLSRQVQTNTSLVNYTNGFESFDRQAKAMSLTVHHTVVQSPSTHRLGTPQRTYIHYLNYSKIQSRVVQSV
jgi:hypothetical protein